MTISNNMWIHNNSNSHKATIKPMINNSINTKEDKNRNTSGKLQIIHKTTTRHSNNLEKSRRPTGKHLRLRNQNGMIYGLQYS
jgi:hypothetical protein